jgi:hypothetical protein
MLFSPSTPGAFDKNMRDILSKIRDERTTVRPATEKDNSPNRRFTRLFMAKREITPAYFNDLQKFAELLQAGQQKALDEKGKTNTVVTAIIESGRKFDKVKLAFIRADKPTPKPETVYFVDREDGAIYGVKSQLAPNLKWYFGNIKNSDKWDWSGKHGVPVNDTSVREIGKYGDYKHFERVELSAAVAG